MLDMKAIFCYIDLSVVISSCILKKKTKHISFWDDIDFKRSNRFNNYCIYILYSTQLNIDMFVMYFGQIKHAFCHFKICHTQHFNDVMPCRSITKCSGNIEIHKNSSWFVVFLYEGNRIIHRLTESRQCRLRVELENWDGIKGYAMYDDFYVSNETDGFRLRIGTYSGTAGNVCLVL